MALLDDIGLDDTKVSFIDIGEYERLNKRNFNLMTIVWSHSRLFAYILPIIFPRMISTVNWTHPDGFW